MEGYIKKMIFLGENIQTIRKHRKMKQQELADKIGINMQSLSKIERGVNYPTFDTLEKIMDVDVYKRQPDTILVFFQIFHKSNPPQIPIEQNRCAMACQGCGAVYISKNQ